MRKKSEEKNRFLVSFFKISILVHFGIILLQNMGIVGAITKGTVVNDISGNRLYSTFNGSYEFSAYLILLMPLLLNDLKNNKYNIFYLFLIFISIYLSQSRTSLVIFLLMIFAFWILDNNIGKKATIKYFIVFVILVISLGNLEGLINYLPRSEKLDLSGMIDATMLAWNNRNIDRYIATGSYDVVGSSSTDLSFRARISRDMTLMEGVERNPFLGVGLSIVKIAADCNYIRLLAETGFLGLLTYLWCIFYTYRLCKNEKDIYSKFVRYGILGLCLGSIFIDIFEASKIMMIFWFIVGVSCYYRANNTSSIGAKKNE